MATPQVSIIIPAKNASATLSQCLNSLRRLNYPACEVIVINDGSTDETPAILAAYPEVTVLSTSGIGPSACRNLGLEKAQGTCIAFTDADCIVDKEWLNELLKGFTFCENVVGVGGTQLIPEDCVSFEKKVRVHRP